MPLEARRFLPFHRAMAPPTRRVSRRTIAAFALLFLLYGYAGHVEPDWLEVTRHEVPLAVPRPIKLAHVSDLHTVGLELRERRMVAALEEERPDAIVITGDTLSQSGSYEQCRPVLEKLKAPLGVFMVPGNWEVANPIRDMKGFFASCGVKYLRNESVELVPGVWLVGLDDFSLGLPNWNVATAHVPADATKIVLCHAPGFFKQTHGEFALALAGHTHGGQVRIPGFDPLYLPTGCGNYFSGWFEQDGARMYVSRGIGMSGPRFRFLCRPELAFHDLVPAK
jgi:predicted MPP superfamily phosphohydrolase